MGEGIQERSQIFFDLREGKGCLGLAVDPFLALGLGLFLAPTPARDLGMEPGSLA